MNSGHKSFTRFPSNNNPKTQSRRKMYNIQNMIESVGARLGSAAQGLGFLELRFGGVGVPEISGFWRFLDFRLRISSAVKLSEPYLHQSI